MRSGDDWLSMILANPDLTRYAFDHDHQHSPVVGSFHERAGPGMRPLPSFHCPQCGVVSSSRARRDYWQQHATIEIAMSQGNVLPCSLCFPLLSRKFTEEFKKHTGKQK